MRAAVRKRIDAARNREPIAVRDERPRRKPAGIALDPARTLTPALIAEAHTEARLWGAMRGGPYQQRSAG